MRRFILGFIVALLAFLIGITTAIVLGKVNLFEHPRSGCAYSNRTPPPPPAPVSPIAPQDVPPAPPPPAPDTPRRTR